MGPVQQPPKMGAFFGARSSQEMDTIIADQQLRLALVDASLKMEHMLREGQITLDHRIVSKTEWGLEIDIEMYQPKEDKPIIFRYVYSINRMTFKQWLDEHPYLLGGPLLMFTNRGMDFIVPTDNFQKTRASMIIKYGDVDDDPGSKYEPPIVEEPITMVVHREVVNNHDWIVKCIVT